MGVHDFNCGSGGPPQNNNNTGNNSGGSGIPPGGPGWQIPAGGGQQVLAEEDILAMMINMNETDHKPCLFRENVIRQLMGVLISCQKPNAILVGQAGTGKTAIVEELANMIKRQDPQVPTPLYGYTIFSLPLSNIMAGTKYRGELEVKLNSLVEYLSNKQNKAIIFIDEIHMLCNQDESYREIAQVLKPALSRGSLHVIGATTIQEIKNLEKDPAFNRRFDRILVDELTKSQTLTILNNLRGAMFNHYNAQLLASDADLELLINIADEYSNAGLHRPDNAITLFDRTIAELIMARQDMLNSPNPAVKQAAQSMLGLAMTEKVIKKTAMRLATGNSEPVEFDEQKIAESVADIYGQEQALKEILRQIKIHAARLHPCRKPLTMLFAGPSGVGKTEITKRIAQSYLNEKPIILNMTEYSSSMDVNKIIGASAGYVGYDENTEMPFDALRTNPYKIILLDEFEKCHKSIQRLFMRVFDEGSLQDSHGRFIDFTKAIIIVTTNAGCTNVASTIGLQPLEPKITTKLEDYFDTELLGRFENRILQFNSISREVFAQIMASDYEKEVARIKQSNPRVPLSDTIPDDDLKELVGKSYDILYGARPVHATVIEYIDKVLVP